MQKREPEQTTETPLTEDERKAIEKLNPADATDRILLNLFHRLAFPDRNC